MDRRSVSVSERSLRSHMGQTLGYLGTPTHRLGGARSVLCEFGGVCDCEDDGGAYYWTCVSGSCGRRADLARACVHKRSVQFETEKLVDGIYGGYLGTGWGNWASARRGVCEFGVVAVVL